MLVEDHDDSRAFMRALLESEGHVVTVAGNVADAMQALGDGAVMFDVLVSDLALPDGTGWDLITHARARWPSMRVGVVTGWEGGGATVPVDFLLRKPVRTTELLAQVVATRSGELAPVPRSPIC